MSTPVVQSDLLDTGIEAHGGLERWRQLDSVSARSTSRPELS